MEPEYPAHLKSICTSAKEALQKAGFDSLVIHAGTPDFYHADDIEKTFHSIPHFKRFVPLDSPHHVLVVSKDKNKPLLVEVIPADYWEAYVDPTQGFWKDEFEYATVKTADEVWTLAQNYSGTRTAFVGDTASGVKAAIIPNILINPPDLIASLNQARASKTHYEIDCLSVANKRASLGHIAARDAFMAGMSELDIHYIFLKETKSLEVELPYPTIVGLNEKSSVLHYYHKRRDILNGKSLLIDAGVTHLGYASDISRTYVKNANPVFESLLASLETLQKELCRKIVPGTQFIELHHEAHLGIAQILKEKGIATIDGEGLIASGVTRAFLPHGLGHMLGLQVHDVGGTSDEPFQHPLQELYPKIRTNRTLEAGNVTTIEPGLYFIPLLLDPLRASPETSLLLNWKLIEELTPFGGIRIEDNLAVTSTGTQNLTRAFLP